MDKVLGLNYKLKRMSLGLSQEQLCEQIHLRYGYIVVPQQISELENAKRIPSPSVINYLNHTLSLTWDDLLEDYLNHINEPRDLLDLLELLLIDRSSFSNKVMRKLVRTVKGNPTPKNLQINIRAMFYYVIWKSKYKRSKVLNLVKKLMSEIPKKSQINLLEEFYLYSNNHTSLHKYIWFTRPMFDMMIPFKVNHFTILEYYSSALFKEKRYLDIVLLSEKMQEILADSNCPEKDYLSFTYRFALSYLYLGYFSESRDRLIEILNRINDNRELKRDCHHAIAFSYFKEKKYVKAKSHWDEALSLCSDYDSKKIRILSYYCYTEILSSNGEAAENLYYQTQLCLDQLAGETEGRIDLALHMRNEALFRIKNKEYRKAIELLVSSIEILKNTPYEDEVMNSWLAVLYGLGRNAIDSSSNVIKEAELNSIMSLT
ncbi:helix-turn-helix transcriptional regulator [Bacillus sp. REN3]|uniref:helix-turn-helix transcriptional regulator n=1 Tax=Bacillus sp. REN3 TaxID=2802440 RepID=UPI001AEE0388|nr:helix-turn-helix transcriptional regulator [Bacillus sp. REN3]